MADDRAGVLRRGVEAVVSGEADALSDLFTENVSGWSPNLMVSSLDELKEVTGHREDALSDVKLDVDALDIVGNKGYMEYRLSAVFSGPLTIDDETVLDPTGGKIEIGAALVAEFEGDKISAFRNYFDDLSLMEQLLVG